MRSEAKRKRVAAVGTSRIGTYICSYFVGEPHATHSGGGGGGADCELTCPLRLPSRDGSSATATGETFKCHIQEKMSHGDANSKTAWDVLVFHYGAPPVAPDPSRQMVVFYSGESNITEAKRAKAEYQRKFHHVVSCHHTRRFFFTWTARFRREFLAIAAKNTGHNSASAAASAAQMLRREWRGRIDAVVIFVSRCGKGGRDKIIDALRASGIAVHSLGKCQRTHRVAELHPECVKDGAADGAVTGAARYAQKLCVYRKYRYALALDNTNEEDYVTEKIYHALVAGAVPLYDGAPNIDDFVPSPTSYIPLTRFLKKHGGGAAAASSTPSLLRTDPKAALDFARMRRDMAALDAAAAANAAPQVVASVAGGGGGAAAVHAATQVEEENAATFWLDGLLSWRLLAGAEEWPARFRANIEHPEPTCDICNLALRRRCEPNA